MIKFLTMSTVILLVFAIYSHFQAELWKNKAQNLVKINHTLNLTIERVKHAETEANKTIKSLRQSAQACETNLDWYREPVPADVLDELRKRHNRHRGL